jgi:hypothetical protein
MQVFTELKRNYIKVYHLFTLHSLILRLFWLKYLQTVLGLVLLLKKIFSISLNSKSLSLNFIFLLHWVGVHCGTYLKCIKYIILEFTPSTTLLYPLFPYLRNSFNWYIFSIYIHGMCSIVTLLHLFSNSFPSHWYQTPTQHLFLTPVF